MHAGSKHPARARPPSAGAAPGSSCRPVTLPRPAVAAANRSAFFGPRRLTGQAQARNHSSASGASSRRLLALAQPLGDQPRQVAPLAQRRQHQVGAGQPAAQVVAEAALAHPCQQVGMRGGNHAHADTDRLRRADRQQLALGQHAQQPRLQRQRHVADLVEEQRAAVGLLDQTALVPGTSASAAGWPGVTLPGAGGAAACRNNTRPLRASVTARRLPGAARRQRPRVSRRALQKRSNGSPGTVLPCSASELVKI